MNGKIKPIDEFKMIQMQSVGDRTIEIHARKFYFFDRDQYNELMCRKETLMFRVVTPKFDRTFTRWTDALEQAKSLQAECKSLFEDIRIYQEDELVWVYSLSHAHPQYIGAGTYNKLARRFIYEAVQEEEARSASEAGNEESV